MKNNINNHINRKLFLSSLSFEFERFKERVMSLQTAEEILDRASQYAFYERVLQMAKYSPETISDEEVEALLQEESILDYLFDYWTESECYDLMKKLFADAADDTEKYLPVYAGEITLYLPEEEGSTTYNEFYHHTVKNNNLSALRDMVMPACFEASRQHKIPRGTEISIEIVISENGEYFDSDEFEFHSQYAGIPEDGKNIIVEGYAGTWHVIDTEVRVRSFSDDSTSKYYLLENDEHGKEIPNVIITENGLVLESVLNGFKDLRNAFNEFDHILKTLADAGYRIEKVEDGMAVTLKDQHAKYISINSLSELRSKKLSLKQRINPADDRLYERIIDSFVSGRSKYDLGGWEGPEVQVMIRSDMFTKDTFTLWAGKSKFMYDMETYGDLPAYEHLAKYICSMVRIGELILKEGV